MWPEVGGCDFRWLPREETFTISKALQVDHVQEVHNEMGMLHAKVDANHASLAAGQIQCVCERRGERGGVEGENENVCLYVCLYL